MERLAIFLLAIALLIILITLALFPFLVARAGG
jgi:hypothetical protein